MDKKKRIRFLYNETAPHYDKRYTDIQNEKYRAALEKLKVRGKILDIGGGTGLFSQFISETVDVLDLSIELLKVGMEKNKGGNWIAGDGESLPFRDGAFDTVVSFSAVQNFPDRKKGVLEIKRVLLQHNGRFALTVLAKTMTKEELHSILSEAKLDFEELDISLEDIGVVGQTSGGY